MPDAPRVVLTGGGNPSYEVQKGDSLAKISAKYTNVSVAKLRELNPQLGNVKDDEVLDNKKIPKLQLPQGAQEKQQNGYVIDWGKGVLRQSGICQVCE